MIPTDLYQLDELSVARILSPLTEVERRVIQLRFGLLRTHAPVTLEGTGQAVGMTREEVRQTELRAMRKLGWSSTGL